MVFLILEINNIVFNFGQVLIIGIMEYIMLMFFIIGVGWMNEFDKNGLKFFEEKMFLNLV